VHAKHGPSFLRAVLSVLHENADKAMPRILIHEKESNCNWGAIKYDNPEDWLEDERAWYNLLTKSEDSFDDLIHWCGANSVSTMRF
jgi:hypothetical protein